MADKYGGKLVMAGGIAWFSLASMLVPLALSDAVVKAGLTLPALLAARCMVVSWLFQCWHRHWLGASKPWLTVLNPSRFALRALVKVWPSQR